MRNYKLERDLETDNDIYLAAICQTAIHGWHGIDDPEKDCIAKKISEILNIDPALTFWRYQDDPYYIPVYVINGVKKRREKFLNNRFNSWELCYPINWLIIEFKK